VWPVFLRFRGGKGVATAAGVFLALLPVPTLFAAGVFALVLALTRYVSLGSLLGAIALIGGALLRREPPPLSAVAVLAGILIFYKHRSNIARLMRGEEQAIGRRN
jgi:glycerol-3-phosphate acyltransferase PlsY